jgi:hypothetical protein
VEGKKMERIKQFFSDDSASSELVTSMLLIGAAIVVGGAAIGTYYLASQGFFNATGGKVDGMASAVEGSKAPLGN